MLKFRMWTASILMLFILAMMWFLPAPIFAVTVIIFYIPAAWEWSGLAGLRLVSWRLAYIALVLLAIGFCYFLPAIWILTLAIIVWIWAAIATYTFERQGMALGFQQPIIKGLSGIFMLAACWLGVTLLQAASPFWFLMALVLIWVVDTGAYFAGKRWGKHPLAPRISPKKTWEGLWGGVFLALLIMVVTSLLVPINTQQRLLFMVLALICALFAVIGDLFVSLLKRHIGIKDSGILLPGHGGFLDRLDSTVSTIPFFALGFLLLKL